MNYYENEFFHCLEMLNYFIVEYITFSYNYLLNKERTIIFQKYLIDKILIYICIKLFNQQLIIYIQ